MRKTNGSRSQRRVCRRSHGVPIVFDGRLYMVLRVNLHLEPHKRCHLSAVPPTHGWGDRRQDTSLFSVNKNDIAQKRFKLGKVSLKRAKMQKELALAHVAQERDPCRSIS